MTTNNLFNIQQQGAMMRGLTPRNRAAAPNLPENGVLQAIIMQNDAKGTILQLKDGENLNIRHGQVDGNVGDTVFFEVERNGENVALRQIFPHTVEQNFIADKYSLKNLQDLMVHKDFAVTAENPMDANALAEERAELARKADAAVAKLSRSINRISGNARGAAVAELAAAGIDIDKVSIQLLDSVTSQLDAAKATNSDRVLDELNTKLDSIMGLSDGQIARMLQSGADITLENLYIYKHSGNGEAPVALAEGDWQDLVEDVARFFDRENIEKTAENLDRARFLLENSVPLTPDNFLRLIFLSDIEGNVVTENLLESALALDAAGNGIGKLDVYSESKKQMAEARLMMSYEANLPLIGTDLEMDLTPQIEAMNQLREREAELLTALREAQIDTAENRQAIADTFRSLFTLPFVNFAAHAAIAEKRIDFTPSAVENFINTQNYEANATVANLKYGDNAAKIAEQFAPLLKELGLPTDDADIRAAKILSANNIDITAENLLAVKDIDAKITDVTTRLHPRMAAQMIAEGLNPATMHIDQILERMAAFETDFGVSDLDKLARNIVEMDNNREMDEALRQKVVEIYQMLHKISKNNGAGIGFAVNAGVELTLENLMDFSKNFNMSKGRRNTINYTANDGTYYAKHLVTSFISAAQPKPLATFVQTESMADHLSQSVEKLENIAKNIEESQLDTQRINQAISELETSGRDNIRLLVSAGLPVTITNMRHLKAVRERKLDEDVNALSASELAQASESLQGTDLAAYNAGETPASLNESLAAHVETARENATNPEKITKLDILMQNLNFRNMLTDTISSNFSCAMRFNGRIADVAMYVINDEMDVDAGVTAYISLNTAMGAVSGLLNMQGNTADIRFAADEDAANYLRQNQGFLAEMLSSAGMENIDITFVDNSTLKRQLSVIANLPI